MRAFDLGSNPHSNGEFFSLSENVFFDTKFKIININIIISLFNAIIIMVDKIIYTSL